MAYFDDSYFLPTYFETGGDTPVVTDGHGGGRLIYLGRSEPLLDDGDELFALF
jgi:hypothetical protein